MEYFRIKYVPFPDMLHNSIKGMATRRDGKTCTIVIDSRLNAADRLHALKHELSHIFLDHHHQEARALKEIEAEAEAHEAAMTEDEFDQLMSYERR